MHRVKKIDILIIEIKPEFCYKNPKNNNIGPQHGGRKGANCHV